MKDYGTIKAVPVLPFIGCISSPGMEEILEKKIAEQGFGATGLKGGPFPFTATDYYADEMGKGLTRRFFAFKNLTDPSRMPDMKDTARELEARYSEEGRRRVNIDPGYIDLFKVVLVSAKYGGMKIHIGSGYYADIVLFYQGGRFHAAPRTFPDFRYGVYEGFFSDLRNVYINLVNAG